jgi:predicted aspartyl protease
MGTFFIEAWLAAPQRPERREPVRLLVDSGSTYTWIATPILRALGVTPTERRRVVTIEGQIVVRDLAEVLITLEGRTMHTVCLFGDALDLDVLGAYTLEGFGLAIDPVQRRLIPALQYGAAAKMTDFKTSIGDRLVYELLEQPSMIGPLRAGSLRHQDSEKLLLRIDPEVRTAESSPHELAR